MDRRLVEEAARRGTGRVVIVPLAAASGREYDMAGANGVRHFASLGAEAVVASDARHDPADAAAAMATANLLVLPGGSPARLLTALTGTAPGEALRRHIDGGGVVMGASAGAMVLAERMWDPTSGRIVDGLGFVRGHLVLPHFDGRRALPQGAGAGIVGLGLPEQSGVLVVAGALLGSVGNATASLVHPGGVAEPIPAAPAPDGSADRDAPTGTDPATGRMDS
jgi:cyanophycinase-like exopeptidase